MKGRREELAAATGSAAPAGTDANGSADEDGLRGLTRAAVVEVDVDVKADLDEAAAADVGVDVDLETVADLDGTTSSGD